MLYIIIILEKDMNELCKKKNNRKMILDKKDSHIKK